MIISVGISLQILASLQTTKHLATSLLHVKGRGANYCCPVPGHQHLVVPRILNYVHRSSAQMPSSQLVQSPVPHSAIPRFPKNDRRSLKWMHKLYLLCLVFFV